MLHRDEYRQMLLAGTVTFPATFPQVGRLDLRYELLPVRDGEQQEVLVVSESPSPKVTMTRRVPASSVRAVFLPRDPRHVNYADGQWLLAGEVVHGLKSRLKECQGAVYGIAFVGESEPSLLSVSAGMTAAESAQYYPPLPGDPSNNHYNPWPDTHSPGVAPIASCVVQSPCSVHDQSQVGLSACASADPWMAEQFLAMPFPKACLAADWPVAAEERMFLSACDEFSSYPFPTDDLMP